MSGLAAPRAFGAGLIALDIVMSADSKVPPKAFAGGTCGNVLTILGYLGWTSFPVGRLSDDPAAQRIKQDLTRWGVRLDYASCAPAVDTPIIVQEIRVGKDGEPRHKFSWSCPRCGQWLPSYKPITRAAVDPVREALPGSSVFFMDRVSSASLTLARAATEEGAVVVFEPSAKGDPKLVREALKLAHIIKYADSRLDGLGELEEDCSTLVEIQTLGASGLRYRHRLSKAWSEWDHLPSLAAPRLSDSCGAGDWCTAGLLSKLCNNGLSDLVSSTANDLKDALRYGQALAAWNCGFEGARGGMYISSKSEFEAQISAISAGHLEISPLSSAPFEVAPETSCPACTPVASDQHVPRTALSLAGK